LCSHHRVAATVKAMSGTTLAGLGQSRRRAPAPGQNTVVLNVSSVRGPFGDISSRLSIIRRILQSCSQSRSRPCDFVCDAQRWRPRPADRQRPRASSIFMWPTLPTLVRSPVSGRLRTSTERTPPAMYAVCSLGVCCTSVCAGRRARRRRPLTLFPRSYT